MSTLRYWVKVSRLTQCVIGGTTAWIISLLSNGPTWVTLTKLSAGGVMFFSVWGASVWHYGARADIYAKKPDPVHVDNPVTLLCAGAAGFLVSILLACIFLPVECAMIAAFNAIIIMCFYARVLDRYWPWKNISIAGICITPLILGWFSGHRLDPIIPPIIGATFFFYLSREMVKDVGDRIANQGKRFTMVMDIGITAAMRVAGVMLVISMMLFLYSLKHVPASLSVRAPFILGLLYLSWFALHALKGKDISAKFPWMDVGVGMILCCLLLIRAQMY